MQRPVALAQAVAAGKDERDGSGGHRPGGAIRRDRDGDAAPRARLEIDEVEAHTVACEQHEALDALEARLRHRRGVVVEPVEPLEEIRRQWTGVLGQERPPDAVDLERRQVVGREDEGAVGLPGAALDPDEKGADPVVRHAV